MTKRWRPLGEYVILSLSTTAALLILAAIVPVAERIGVIDFPEAVHRMLGRETSAPVNVEALDMKGTRLDLGPYVSMDIRNTSGKACRAAGGIFLECNPAWIRPGKLVHLDIQDGKVREDLVVTYDGERKTLFIQSAFTTAEILARIHKMPGPAPPP